MEKTKVVTRIAEHHTARVAADVLDQIETETQTHRQVIVHCTYAPDDYVPAIRIWPSTFLRDKDSDFKSQLITAYNISFYPHWGSLNGRNKTHFTLVFGGLPNGCTAFDLLEDIPEWGGFTSGIIQRNKEDVYHVLIK